MWSRKTKTHDPPLWNALSIRDQRQVATLLDAGADPNAKGANGMTVLMFAAYTDDAPSARLLLDHGADVNAVLRDGTTALHYTQNSLRGNPEVVTLLLEKGADVDAATEDGYTALIGATGSPHRGDALRILIAGRADLNREWQGVMPLTWALMLSQGAENGITRMLRAAGAK